MPGFLDPHAVSVEAEYTRYLNPDVLGKIVLKNFALNILELSDRQIRIPIARHGDIGNYRDLSDAGIRLGNRWYSVESKCSYHTITTKSRYTADPSARWNFSGLLHSPRSRRERAEYEIAFCVGVDAPGLEDSQAYWRHLHTMRKQHLNEGRAFDFSVWPHSAAFLTRCGFFIIPRIAVRVNQLDVTIRNIPQARDRDYFAWGYDFSGLRRIWQNAVDIVNSNPPRATFGHR